MTNTNTHHLKLMALDGEDLNILSAHCQDSVLKAGDMKFFSEENRFQIEMNRFVWEKQAKKSFFKKSIPERRRSVLHFEQVQSVSSAGINLNAKENVLSLLAIKFEETNSPGGTVELVFSGETNKTAPIAVRLQVECIEAQLADMPGAWAASSTPKHA
ncbi:MAG: DUF2948 family protein [Nitratireductor sp.]